ncbi:MAG: hypothetical protein RKP20_04785 [Candidatus Competibacter sp.]|nr:hypothetical protein [Candidatus Competibacter sp.]
MALAQDARTLLLVPVFLILFLTVRGLLVLIYRHDLPKPERLPFALSASVASLSLVVVITQIRVYERDMRADIAQALTAAALLSMLVYPTLAGLLARTAPPASSADAR